MRFSVALVGFAAVLVVCSYAYSYFAETARDPGALVALLIVAYACLWEWRSW